MTITRRRSGYALPALVFLSALAVVAMRLAGPGVPHSALERSAPPDKQVLQGRYVVLNHGCGGCHGGFDDPSSPGWLAIGGPEASVSMKIFPPRSDRPCGFRNCANSS